MINKFFQREQRVCQILLLLFITIFTYQCKKKDKENNNTTNNNNNEVIITAPTVTDIDGNIYKTCTIGNQIWMAENLNTTTHAYGQSMCYNGDEHYCASYGRLYSWEAALNGDSPLVWKPRGICPEGWYLPGDQQWGILEVYLGMPPEDLYLLGDNRGTDEGVKLMSEYGWRNGNGGSDDYNFEALPAGRNRPGMSPFSGLGQLAFFWTPTEMGNGAIYRTISSEGVGRNFADKDNMYSVRCVKDIE